MNLSLDEQILYRLQQQKLSFIGDLRVVPKGGIEPPTQRFSVACSTD
ncbi:unnamed protein product [Commensalibacter communis]|nr:unnamed protein product [Commensalibacter communis]CAI3958352.1 unnamed protein product [Commensalibacter communis]